MPSYFDRGILDKSSWHGLEEVGEMADAVAMIAAGERTGAWPIKIDLSDLFVIKHRPGQGAHLKAPGKGVLATYREHEPRCLGTVGDRYRPTAPKKWRDLVRAACSAGAKPTGAFSLKNGAKILATFEVARDDETTTQLLLLDSFDGSTQLCVGFTVIRVVCANTLAISLKLDGKGMAKVRHTTNMDHRIEMLERAIETAIESGKAVVDEYNRAKDTMLTGAQAQAVFDALFPPPDPESAPIAQTKAYNARLDATTAAQLPQNKVGKPGCLGNLLNAATWLVDRKADGNPRSNGDRLNTLLSGQRGKRLAEIRYQIQIAMSDGTTRAMDVPDAIELGVDSEQIGKVLLDDMLENC